MTPWGSVIEAEVGRVEFVLPETIARYTSPKEYFRSICFEELSLLLCTSCSYRKSEKILNRALHRPRVAEIRLTTLNDHVDSLGKKASTYLMARSGEILGAISGYAGDLTDPAVQGQLAAAYPEPETAGSPGGTAFQDQIEAFNDGKENSDQIKNMDLVKSTEADPENTVYVSIDDVGVQHQKDSRKDSGGKNKKRVENTVIHVESSGKKHIITAVGMHNAFTLLMAFLISNGLLDNRNLVFFSDGAQNIRSCIETFFSFRKPVTHMLDWYHLEKRMKEFLSMSVKGNKESKKAIRNVLDRRLWAGNVDDAIDYLKSIPAKSIKNQQKLEEAVDYLVRRKPHIPCYALRSLLGYRNSSNPAEKANDRVVAMRQKHNGMSWSTTGSSSLALITALELNNELDSWIAKGTIAFNIDSQSTAASAA